MQANVRPVRLLPAALLLGVLCADGPAAAQALAYRGIFAGGFQWTDNVNFTPMNGPQPANASLNNPQGKPQSAVTLNLNPSILGSLETPRTLNELQYIFTFMGLVGGAGNQVNYTNRLELRTRFDADELTVMNFAFRVAQGEQAIFPDPPPGQAAAVIVPGYFKFGTVEANEGLNHRITPYLVYTQALAGNVFYPIDAQPARPSVFGANFASAVNYNDDPDTYGVTFNSQFVATEDLACDPNPLVNTCGGNRTCSIITHRCVIDSTVAGPARQELEAKTNVPQLASRLAGTYRHDFKNGFLGELDLGVQNVLRLTDGGGQFWQPAGRLAVRYDQPDGAVALTLNHGTALNIDLGGIVLGDNADLIGTIPIDRETRNWVVQLQAGYQRGTLINAFGELLPGFQLFAGDVALTYRPQRWLPNLFGAVRYQFRYQIADPANNGTRIPIELHALRNAVLFNVGFEYPERQQGK